MAANTPEDNTPDTDDLRDHLARYILSPQLSEMFGGRKLVPVIIEINTDHNIDTAVTKRRLHAILLESGVGEDRIRPLELSHQFVFVRLTGAEAKRAVGADVGRRSDPDLKRIIWPDESLRPFIDRSVRTIKADASRSVFAAEGEGIVWAVVDSGIDENYAHFATHRTLHDLPVGASNAVSSRAALHR